jgi:hypothetical protein
VGRPEIKQEPVAMPTQPEPTPTPAEWPPPGPKAEDKPKEEEKERDYSRELQTAIGSPLGCLKPRPSDRAPPEIVIHIGAHVMPSGGVGRAEVSSPQLDADEVKCVRQLAEARRLSPPIEDAPRRVDATIRLEPKPAPKPTPDPNAPKTPGG